MTPDQRLEYELSISVERDLSAALDTSFEDGMEKGIEKGKAEGMKHGVEKGKAEEQLLIAANLKKQGINIETIAQCTGLSVKEVSEL